MKTDLGKKVLQMVGAASFTCVLFFAPVVEANICDSSYQQSLYRATTLNSPSHLQVFQVGNTIRVTGRLIYDFDYHWDTTYGPVPYLTYGCGFSVEILKDALPAGVESSCQFHMGSHYGPWEIGIAGGNRVYIDESTAGCDIDATFQIPNSGYFSIQDNNKIDMLVVYPWWAMAEGDAISGWTYPCSPADFGEMSHACDSYNQGTVSEHIKLNSGPVNATCGTNAGTYLGTDTRWRSNSATAFCATGTLVGAMPVFPTTGSVAWTCNGLNAGTNISCTAAKAGYYWLIGAWGACVGTCGTPGTQTRTVECKDAATGLTVDDSLCPAPKPELTQTCTMPACPAACGSDAGGSTCTKPTDPGLCSVGTTTWVFGTGVPSWTWTCRTSVVPITTANCSSTKAPTLAGVCGSADDATLTSAPSSPSELCTVGAASIVTGTGPWNWSCSGVCDGGTTLCSASVQEGGGGGGGGDDDNWIEVEP